MFNILFDFHSGASMLNRPRTGSENPRTILRGITIFRQFIMFHEPMQGIISMACPDQENLTISFEILDFLNRDRAFLNKEYKRST